MNDILTLTLETALVIITADFASGIVHWFEDAYIREDTPLVGQWIGKANTLHHHLPRAMTRNSWWQSSWDLVLGASLLMGGAALLGCLTWHMWLFTLIVANSNEVHKWSHRTRKENGRVISWLQDWRIIQTPKHHAIHHTNPKEVHYCPITNLLNPVLDGVHFWAGLEWVLERCLRLKRKPDTSVPGQGSVPIWITELRSRPVATATKS
jgi:ubiquitin-conjugating enzyme E2 variant